MKTWYKENWYFAVTIQKPKKKILNSKNLKKKYYELSRLQKLDHCVKASKLCFQNDAMIDYFPLFPHFPADFRIPHRRSLHSLLDGREELN